MCDTVYFQLLRVRAKIELFAQQIEIQILAFCLMRCKSHAFCWEHSVGLIFLRMLLPSVNVPHKECKKLNGLVF